MFLSASINTFLAFWAFAADNEFTGAFLVATVVFIFGVGILFSALATRD
jgi:hypothetical protein|tara:strand:+ start:19893 stop:20039 length:147 start_codon:yes stop_codon:yes gene_type:complete